MQIYLSLSSYSGAGTTTERNFFFENFEEEEKKRPKPTKTKANKQQHLQKQQTQLDNNTGRVTFDTKTYPTPAIYCPRDKMPKTVT